MTSHPQLPPSDEISVEFKKKIVAGLGFLFLASLVATQFIEHSRREREHRGEHSVNLSEASRACHDCHKEKSPGIVEHWRKSKHSSLGVGCYECHAAEESDLDAWKHEGRVIATIVTPKDCSRCHKEVFDEFEESHHARAGNILHSLDNLLAEVVEGHRGPVTIPNPHKPGEKLELNGLAFANSGCHQCHGSQVALELTAGGLVNAANAKDVKASQIARHEDGRPKFDSKTWPNTGIGRLNLDGSRGSCSACHSRHDFSARRARRPENCGKCHLGPDHPQKEIYEESKHGIAYRDMKNEMNLDSDTWILGKDYSAAPTCATCHMSATRTQPITHDPGKRISWTNRPPISLRLDTDKDHKVIKETDPVKRKALIAMSWQEKRSNMKEVCNNCHSPGYVNSFYKQYDDFVMLFNGKYAIPGTKLMKALKAKGLISKPNFDDEIEWTWFYLWHHEGRRARHGASMMAPDYAHWHGTYEVAERWYVHMIPQAREIIEHAKQDPAKRQAAEEVEAVLNEILSRPEHLYATTGKMPKPAK
jgi:hydroxylamine dehydrogenase